MEFPNWDLPATFSILHTKSNVGQVELWPNPTHGDFSVRVNTLKTSDANLQIADMRGVIVYSQRVQLKDGTNNLQVPVHQQALTPGIYTVQLNGDGLRAIARVVVY